MWFLVRPREHERSASLWCFPIAQRMTKMPPVRALPLNLTPHPGALKQTGVNGIRQRTEQNNYHSLADCNLILSSVEIVIRHSKFCNLK